MAAVRVMLMVLGGAALFTAGLIGSMALGHSPLAGPFVQLLRLLVGALIVWESVRTAWREFLHRRSGRAAEKQSGTEIRGWRQSTIRNDIAQPPTSPPEP